MSNPKLPRWKAKVDDPVNLLPLRGVVVVTAPFYQNDWITTAPLKVKARVDDTTNLLPLRAFQPFNQKDWTTVAALKAKAKVDDPINLLPLQAFRPFNQFDWILAKRASQPAKSDVFNNPLPLQFFSPFNQFDWANPALRRSSAAAREFLSAGGSVGPIPPTSKAKEWIIRARRRGKR